MHTVSFFSFKGGVGRTNLLLNCAYKLASDGAFVVVADWDLHAPGLTMMEAMAQPAEEEEELEGPDVRRGVLDFLDTALDAEGEIPDPRSMARPTRLAERSRSRKNGPAGPFRGDVWFVPAGRFDPADTDREFHDQLLRVQSRNLAGWIRRFDHGGEVENPRGVLKYFRDRIAGLEHPGMDGRKPEYLLIDSRTGMTEIGDLLLAADFVDRMVVVCGFNHQNISGLEAVIRDLQQHISPGELHTRLTLAVSPVPQGEEALKQQRAEVLASLLERLRRDIGFGELEFMPELHMIPYHPQIALTEAVMVESFPESDPAKAMLRVVKEIELKKELIPPARPGAGLRPLVTEAGDLEGRLETGSSAPTILHHPWSRLPQWNWPDPEVTIEQFLPELDARHRELLNGFARSTSLAKEQIARMLKSLAGGEWTEHRILEVRRTLREEQRKNGELARKHWPQLLAQGVRYLKQWLELWCERGHGDVKTILESLVAGERDEYLGSWTDMGYFWFCLAGLTRKESLWAAAEKAYRKAIELDPKYAYPWNDLGNLLKTHLERYEEAEAAYRKSVELDLKSAYPWNNLGNLLQNHLERFGEAEAAYRKSAELDPKLADPWNGLATLYQKQGRLGDASLAYRKALEIDPAYLDANQNDAELALLQDDLDRARSRLETCRKLSGKPREERNQAMLELVLALAGGGGEVADIHNRLLELQASIKRPATWNYDDMEPVVERLPRPSQALLRSWIAAVKHQEGTTPEEAFAAYQAASA